MKVSVVCPFYNEATIIENAIEEMVKNLDSTSMDWELILVNDGSTDSSFAIAQSVSRKFSRVKILSYEVNQGRGFALRHGIKQATGEIIVTTEIDLSWGEDIVQRLVLKFEENPKTDFVIASPNLKGGGYKNVPFRRVWMSRLGNILLSCTLRERPTMCTGMTRAYRRQVIQPLETREKGKEFHLEVLGKLVFLGFHFSEVPAVLEWKDEKLNAGKKKRVSSTNIPKIIVSHLKFAAMCNPLRYFTLFSLVSFGIGVVLSFFGLKSLLFGEPAMNFILLSVLMFLVGLIFWGIGIIMAQNRTILEEQWLLGYRQVKTN